MIAMRTMVHVEVHKMKRQGYNFLIGKPRLRRLEYFSPTHTSLLGNGLGACSILTIVSNSLALTCFTTVTNDSIGINHLTVHIQ